MYELARGPLMWAAALIFAAGVLYRIVQLFILTRKKQRSCYTPTPATKRPPLSSEERKLDMLVAFQQSLAGKHPVMAIVSTVFHVCLFAAPLLLVAHSELLHESWGVSFLTLPDSVCDTMTAVLLACCLFFLARRIVVPQVRAVSSLTDYLLLFITAAPFLTGFFAYHQWFPYNTVLVLHMLAGEAMLIAIPFSKLGHMVFFFFVRLLMGSEFSFGSGARVWTP